MIASIYLKRSKQKVENKKFYKSKMNFSKQNSNNLLDYFECLKITLIVKIQNLKLFIKSNNKNLIYNFKLLNNSYNNNHFCLHNQTENMFQWRNNIRIQIYQNKDKLEKKGNMLKKQINWQWWVKKEFIEGKLMIDLNLIQINVLQYLERC